MDSAPGLAMIELTVSVSHDNESNNTTALTSNHTIPHSTRLQWATSISTLFFTNLRLPNRTSILDYKLLLHPDGSVRNLASPSNTSLLPSPEHKRYPPRYCLPSFITQRLETQEERVQRQELFALGSILYETISGHELFSEPALKEKEIEERVKKGEFPYDVWELGTVMRILGCWCPAFAKEILASKGKATYLETASKYIKTHPILFGIQVLGGIATLGSLIALPILGAVGFASAGPVAGSAAAAWQSSIGLVEAGSFFAWCQSAAMGGAAIGGIWAAGLGGVGVAVGAVAAGALDREGSAGEGEGLRERFLRAWERDVNGEEEVGVAAGVVVSGTLDGESTSIEGLPTDASIDKLDGSNPLVGNEHPPDAHQSESTEGQWSREEA